ncbi:DUF4252 domain-containing protein [Flavobacteriaceae bacterium F08102]|nr:DUF4252 domain-containing protein [Flavobacteriaceae bacterium F08102]
MNIITIKRNSKKVIFTITLALIATVGYSQSIFDKFEDLDDVSAVVVNKKMFDMIISVSENDVDFKNMVNGLISLKMFTTKNSTVANQMNAAAAEYLKSAKLSELMRVKDDGNNVKIYVKEGRDKDHIKELFMHVNAKDGESLVFTLIGDIDLKQIAKLTKQMNIPGSEHLNNINKK